MDTAVSYLNYVNSFVIAHFTKMMAGERNESANAGKLKQGFYQIVEEVK